VLRFKDGAVGAVPRVCPQGRPWGDGADGNNWRYGPLEVPAGGVSMTGGRPGRQWPPEGAAEQPARRDRKGSGSWSTQPRGRWVKCWVMFPFQGGSEPPFTPLRFRVPEEMSHFRGDFRLTSHVSGLENRRRGDASAGSSPAPRRAWPGRARFFRWSDKPRSRRRPVRRCRCYPRRHAGPAASGVPATPKRSIAGSPCDAGRMSGRSVR